MHEVRHISTYIARPAGEVYEFAANPTNLPQWAAGLTGADIRQEGESWLAEAPFGKVRIRFAPGNPFGVMDHDVELESGQVFHNPMRVVPHGEGSEFTFTLFRQPGMSDEQFEADRQAVERDLQQLKGILEA